MRRARNFYNQFDNILVNEKKHSNNLFSLNILNENYEIS